MINFTQGVKIILLINLSMFALAWILQNFFAIDLSHILGMFYFKSSNYHHYQIITHMFMHGSILHLLFNMYSLYLFGSMVEQVWGTKRFVFYYIFTGIGAAALHAGVNWWQMHTLIDDAQLFINNPTSDTLALFSENHTALFNKQALSDFLAEWSEHPEITQYSDLAIEQVQDMIDHAINNTCMLGASGAVFGLLLAFGMMYPDIKLYIMFLPIGIKAKYLVLIYGLSELAFGIFATNDGIAHFAHLGGLLFGFIIIKIWQKQNEF